MTFVRQIEAFFFIAGLAGIGQTMSASELWVATQRGDDRSSGEERPVGGRLGKRRRGR
jgi:hypothetical protein